MKFLLLLFVAIILGIANAQTVDPANSLIVGPGTISAVAGNPATTFTIVSRDASNNPVPCGPFDDWVISLTGPDTRSGFISQCLNGNYTVLYTLFTAGRYNLTVSYQGTPISNSPQFPNCTAAVVYPLGSTASGTGILGGIVGTLQEFYVLTKDRYNNVNMTCIPSLFSIQLNGPTIVNGTVTNCFEGNYTIQYTPFLAGPYLLSVLIQGSPILNSPFQINFQPGPLYAANSVATGATTTTFAGDASVIHIQAVDQYNNTILTCLPNTSYSDFLLHAVARQGGLQVNGSITACLLGLYTGSYNVTISGYYDLYITYQSTNVRNSPFLVDVNAGEIDAALTIAQGSGLTYGQAGIPATFSILPRDRFDNIPDYCINSPDIDFNVTLYDTANHVIKGSVSCSGQGFYSAVWSGQIRGAYTLVVAYKGTPIKGSPFSTFLESGLISAANSYATGPGITTARAGTPANFTIHTFDQYNNKIYACEAPDEYTRWAIDLIGPASLSGVVYFCTSGNYSAVFNIALIGTYRMTVDYNSDPIIGSPFDIIGQAGFPYPPNCISYGINNTVEAGITTNFGFFCGDLYNNPITVCDIQTNWMITFTGPESQNYTYDTCANGNYSAKYYTTIAGSFLLAVEYLPDGREIRNSPYPVVVSPGPYDITKFNAEGQGIENIQYAASVSTFQIVSRDRFGNLVTTCLDSSFWRVNISGAPGVIPATVAPCANGRYSVTYTPVRVGNYSIDVSYNTTAISGNPFPITVIPGAIDPTTTYALGDGLFTATAGVPAYFYIVTRDAANNTGLSCLPSANFTDFAIDLTGPASLTGSVENCTNGNYTVRWVGTFAGLYSMTVLFRGSHISGSPFSPEVVPGAIYPNNTFVIGNNLTLITAGNTSDFEIHTRDIYDNIITRCDTFTAFSVRILTSPVTFGYVYNCSNGIYYGNFTVIHAGIYDLHIYYTGLDVRDSPFSLTVLPGPFDSFYSYLVGPGLVSPGVAGEQREFQIISKDRFGNDVSDCYPAQDWSATLGGPDSVTGFVYNCSMGTYNVSYNATIAGNYNLVVKYLDQEIDDSPKAITIIPAALYPPRTNASGIKENAQIGETVTFTILPADRFGNVITDCSSVGPLSNWTVVLINGSFVVNGSVIGCQAGQIQAQFSINISGIYELFVNFDNESISGMPLMITITIGTVSAKNSYATGPGVDVNKVAAGDTAVITVIQKNEFDYQIHECDIVKPSDWRFTTTPPLTTTNITYVSCDNGLITLNYVTTLATDYRIFIYFNDTLIGNVPFYNATIRPGPVYPPNTILTGTTSGRINNSVESFLMHAYDFYSNKIMTGGDRFDCAVEPSCNNASDHKLTDNGDGSYNCTYTLYNGGVFCISALFNGTVIGSSTYYLIEQLLHPEQSLHRAFDHVVAASNFTFDVYFEGGSGCGADQCNYNGVCTNGTCFCKEGYGGAQCTELPSGGGSSKSGLSDGAVAGIVVGVGIFLLIIGLIIGFIIGYVIVKRTGGYVEILDRGN